MAVVFNLMFYNVHTQAILSKKVQFEIAAIIQPLEFCSSLYDW